ncbi:MAG: 30S ribosomal protein S20 [Buchnera aphidicola (Periphyllus lyropictus)]|uniref:30S ribosomal protein S20 n=1 Tax=Buchnera aphidicola TaxID=9 RepID=UPI001EC8288F|nr:30S ribosomal protein S20 [Buchnera aphidicola]NIH16694.1 30S ribosomal protein S20 [Buchnera aphidicola (Periphyllus lyropictus)]USS94601.1 30S ribosomal protein S20 [Buchnera aphidicola (Periphyllus lyropictus)]
MANLKSSKKSTITSEKRRKSNNKKRSIIKTYLKKVLFFISSNDLKKSIFSLKKLQSILDKYSRQGIINKNKASRYKSNLLYKIRNINNEK